MSLTLTENAAKKINSLLEQEENSGLHLRVFVSGGGCSGFQYGFAFDDNQADADSLIKSQGVSLLVDASSKDLLDGSEIDYQESLQGASFVIRNPNASGTCGCGQSFTPADAGAGCAHAGY